MFHRYPMKKQVNVNAISDIISHNLCCVVATFMSFPMSPVAPISLKLEWHVNLVNF